METNAEKAGCQSGVIAILQTYGSHLNFNPHLHMLVPTQVIDPETGGFYESHFPTFWQLRQQWRMKVLNLLRNMKAIDFKTYAKLR